jgi:hypothetical protein
MSLQIRLTIVLLLTGVLLACGAQKVPLEPAHIYQREQPVEIELRDYSFEPNHLVVLGNPSPIRLLLKNTAGGMHNFTLMAPDRRIIVSEDVKPKTSITVDVGPLKSDNYAFYCSLHQYRGMEGMLMID